MLTAFCIDFLLPSPPRLHSDSSEASFPRLSRPCSILCFTAPAYGFDFPPGAHCAVLAGTQILQLVSTTVNNLVAASRAPAMASP